jgi:hypothetical protein
MSFYKVEENEAVFNDMFNEEHSAAMVKELQSQNMNGKTLRLRNCGVRIMGEVIDWLRQLFSSLWESGVSAVDIYYDWDEIMVYPKLVSWDKMSWKNIQQINNWNKVDLMECRHGDSCLHP